MRGRRGIGRRSQEFLQTLRTLTRRPTYMVLAVGTLSLGIAGVTTMGSLTYHVLLKPLAYEAGDEIVQLWWNRRAVRPDGTRYMSVSAPQIRHFIENQRTVRDLAWQRGTVLDVQFDEGVERLAGGRVSPGFFAFLGVQPALGRLDVPDDRESAGLVLSHREWVERWGADPSVVGRSLTVSGVSTPVIGVLPPDFEWIGRPEGARYWRVQPLDGPLGLYQHHLFVKPAVGRTVENVRLDFTQSALVEVGDEDLLVPVSELATAEVFGDFWVGPLRGRLHFLLWATLFLSLLGSLSVSNLLVGRLAERDHEIGIRLSLGGSRFDITRLIGVESAILATAGAIIGVLLARWAVEIIKIAAPDGIPRLSSASLSPEVFGGAVVLTGVVLLVVLVPAAWGTVRQPAAAGTLVRRGAGGGGRRAARARTRLMFTQVAITTVLLVGASLMLRSLHSLATVELGFDPRGVVAGRVSLPEEYSDSDLDQFRQRLAAVPGVGAVAFGQGVPLSASYAGSSYLGGYAITGWRISLEGNVDEDLVRDERGLLVNRVGEDFFEVLDISLIEGRLFRVDDFSRGAADPVAVVSDVLAASYWPGGSAVGQRFALPGTSAPLIEVIGVVEGVRSLRLQQTEQMIYMPLVLEGDQLLGLRHLAFFVSSEGGLTQLMPGVRQAVAEAFPATPLLYLAPIEATVADLMAVPRFYTGLLTFSAVYGLLLSVVGIVAVVHYQTSRRMREMAVRMTLGAHVRDVMGLLGRSAAKIALGGVTVGLLLAAGLAHLVGSFAFDVAPSDVLYVTGLTRLGESPLFGVAPLDPWAFVAVAVLFVLTAVVAAQLPARRLGGLDLVRSLHLE